MPVSWLQNDLLHAKIGHNVLELWRGLCFDREWRAYSSYLMLGWVLPYMSGIILKLFYYMF